MWALATPPVEAAVRGARHGARRVVHDAHRDPAAVPHVQDGVVVPVVAVDIDAPQRTGPQAVPVRVGERVGGLAGAQPQVQGVVLVVRAPLDDVSAPVAGRVGRVRPAAGRGEGPVRGR
jgi:hypothetical protein